MPLFLGIRTPVSPRCLACCHCQRSHFSSLFSARPSPSNLYLPSKKEKKNCISTMLAWTSTTVTIKNQPRSRNRDPPPIGILPLALQFSTLKWLALVVSSSLIFLRYDDYIFPANIYINLNLPPAKIWGNKTNMGYYMWDDIEEIPLNLHRTDAWFYPSTPGPN